MKEKQSLTKLFSYNKLKHDRKNNDKNKNWSN